MENTPAPDTSNFLNWVEIKNFKSIKDLRLDCKRVNIFIGKPNVGKSNILEALGMLGAEYYEEKFMKDVIRYKEIKHLFYENNWKEQIAVLSNQSNTVIRSAGLRNNEFNYFSSDSEYDYTKANISEYVSDHGGTDWQINNEGNINSKKQNWNSKKRETLCKSYIFKDISKFHDYYTNYLIPPAGINLFNAIDSRKDLKNEFGKLFIEQGLDLVLDQDNQSFSLQRKDGFYVYRFDYYTIADTFRRFMFYVAAIESNENSVIVFEEPEVHSFPPYTQDLAYRMVYSEANQFFVSTHSPYLLQTLVENLNDEQVAVFVTYYENYETKVKRLTPEELSFVQEYSTDIFFNLDRFIPTSDAASVS